MKRLTWTLHKKFILDRKLKPLFQGRRGIRIGGALRHEFKEYVSFAAEIVDVDLAEYHLGHPTGAQYLIDATSLPFSQNEEYDFVCSSHVLEHMANPLKALYEWMRVIKPGGIIYIGVPDMRRTFDHKRQRTTLTHLIDDYNKDVDQTDPTHVTEFMENWDESRDIGITRDIFLHNVRNNPLTQIHHHVWITEDVLEIFEYVGLKSIYGPLLKGDTIHIIGKKIIPRI